jgi:hypothetical protein
VQPDLEERARRMPSQGGVAIGPFLRAAAARVPAGSAIVELGAWLGAGTAHLALGAAERADPPTIHVFDRFEAGAGEVGKAAKFGISLRRRQNTLPVVRELLAPFGVPIEYHRGAIDDQTWAGGPIGLQVDDAAKKAPTFFHVLRQFGPSWIPGTTVLVLVDYDFWRSFPPGPKADALRVQHDFVSAHPEVFEPIAEADRAGTPAGFFRYAKALDFAGALPEPPRRRKLTSRRLRRAVARILG